MLRSSRLPLVDTEIVHCLRIDHPEFHSVTAESAPDGSCKNADALKGPMKGSIGAYESQAETHNQHGRWVFFSIGANGLSKDPVGPFII